MIILLAIPVFAAFLLIQTRSGGPKRLGIAVASACVLAWLAYRGFERGVVEAYAVGACSAILSVLTVLVSRRRTGTFGRLASR